ncbi:pilus assembly protein TadE [Massilia sp. UMI-21]|nr:pilus assembly protein TadE [Massilia sp. UMI-21]
MREAAQAPAPAGPQAARSTIPRNRHAFALRRQAGVIGIMLAFLLPVIIGFIALALELGRFYNRKAEMQAVADGIAISAAKKLDGSSNGIDEALAAARDVLESGGDSSSKPRYAYEKTMSFSDAAISFATSPDGDWRDATTARAAPAGLAYVRVDTDGLNAAYGRVDLLFMRVLSSMTSMTVSHTAVAGRQRLKLLPLAICAMSRDPDQPFVERVTADGLSELTEYGFRRGVSYNLLKLSPHTSTAVNYVVDPISLPPKSADFSTRNVGPYVCTGTVELPKVVGETLNVKDGFPIADFVNQLNSRFNVYSGTGKCSPTAAPPDTNIRQYTYTNLAWMDTPNEQVAAAAASASRLQTVADLDPHDRNPKDYGPLWAFARPVPWSAYAPGQAEPPAGYTPFEASGTVWKSLYSTGPGLKTYPTDSKTGLQLAPYFASVLDPATNYPGVRYRRVLNVPLLDCPAAGPAGKVLAVGRFFMTVPANANGIYAEFAGASLQEEVGGPVEVYR